MSATEEVPEEHHADGEIQLEIHRGSKAAQNDNSNDIDSESQLTSDQIFELAETCIGVAAAGRPLNKCLENPEAFDRRLKNYKFVTSRRWKYWMQALVWTHLLLVHWDQGFATLSHNVRGHWALVVVEIGILCFYGVDFYLKYETHDRVNWCYKRESQEEDCARVGQARIFIALVVIVLMDLLIFLGSGLTSVRFSVLVRPGFLILRQRWVRRAFLSLLKSVPDLLLLGLFLTVPMIAYSFAGYALFSTQSKTIFVVGVHVGNSTACRPPAILCPKSVRPGNTYFSTYPETLKSLMVLSTSANFPDVMMQSYLDKPISAWYFFSYAYLSYYFVMPIVFAMVYANFQKFEKEYAEKLQNRSKEAVTKAFRLVSRNGIVCLEDFAELMMKRRGGTRRLAKILFEAAGGSVESGIGFNDFSRLTEYFYIDVIFPNEVARQGMTWSNSDKVMFLFERYQSWVVYHHKRDKVQWVITILTLISVSLVVAQLFSDALWLVVLGKIFFWLFVAEKVVLICAYRSNLSYMEILDSTLVFLCVGLKALVQVMDLNPDAVLVFRVFVILFAAAEVTFFKKFASTCGLVFKYAGSLFVMEFVVLYVFAFIGMLLFSGVLSHEVVLNEISSGNDVSYWEGVLSSFYYENNFNTWWRSMVVVGELTMVNNWMVIYTMFIKLAGPRSLVYFYAVYVVSVLFTMNAIQSVVVDVFKLLHDDTEDDQWLDHVRIVLKGGYPDTDWDEIEPFFHLPTKRQFHRWMYLDNSTKNGSISHE